MLTIFTIPKPFQGHINIIQRNAIKSWIELNSECEIILFGNEEGIAEIAKEFNLRHVPDVACNKFGTPLLNDIFNKVQKLAKSEKIAYVNTDIILTDSFIKAVEKVKDNPYLMIGQRWDLDVDEEIKFDNFTWEDKLRNDLKEKGILHGAAGIDYFVSQRDFWKGIPSFAIGRTSWDNWLIYKARNSGIPVVNATEMITIVHQNHNYSHIPKANKIDGSLKGKESQKNLRLAGGYSHIFTIQDANWVLTDKGFKKRKIEIKYLPRYFDILPVLNPNIGSWPKIISLMLQPKKVIKAMLRRIKKIWKK